MERPSSEESVQESSQASCVLCSLPEKSFPDGDILRTFGNRLRAELGVLLTPPLGKLSPEIRTVQQYVEGLVREVAPADNGWVRLVVTIYSGDTANAFVGKVADHECLDPEGTDLRRHFDPDNGKRPVYEVGVTLGLLRQLQFEDELLFCLSHEIAHYTERHVERESSLGSQTHEPVADSIALDSLANSGRNPIGGWHALERIISQQTAPEEKNTFETCRDAALSSHHDEGLRLTLALAKMRELHEKDPTILDRERTPLPDFVKLSVNPRHIDPHIREEGLEICRDLAERCVEASVAERDESTRIRKVACHVVADGLQEGLRLIVEKPGVSNSEKLDAVVGFVQALAKTQGDAPLILSRDSRWALTRTIMSLLQDGGEFEQTLDRVKQPLLAGSPDRWETLLEPTFLSSVSPLVNRHPAIIDLYSRLPAKVTSLRRKTSETDFGETLRLVKRVSSLGERIDPSIAERIHAGVALALEKGLSDPGLTPGWGMRSTYLLSDTDDKSAFGRAIRSIVDDYVVTSRDALIADVGKNLTDGSGRIPDGLFSLANLLRYSPLTQPERGALETAFSTFFSQSDERARESSMEVDLIGRPELFSFFADLTRAPCMGSHRDAIRDFICSHVPCTNLPRRGPAAEILGILEGELIESLDKKVIIAGAKLPSQANDEAPLRDSCVRHQALNRLVTPIALLSRDRDNSAEIAKSFSFAETKLLIEEITKRSEGLHGRIMRGSLGAGVPLKLSGEAPRFLLDCVVASQHQDVSLASWYQVVSNLMEISPHCLNGRPHHRRALEKFLSSQLDQRTNGEVDEWLRKPHVTDILSSKEFARHLTKLALDHGGEWSSLTRGYHPWGLKHKLDSLESSFHLETKHPEVHRLLREQLAEKIGVQPDEVGIIFPEQSRRSLTDRASGLMVEVRGLSALLAATRMQPAADQLHMIEYLMGRNDSAPTFITELDGDFQERSGSVFTWSLSDLLEDARKQLEGAETSLRVTVVSSFLAGPRGLLNLEQGRDALLTQILQGVSEERMEMARHLSEVLLDSQGAFEALAVGFLQSRSDDGGKPLSEGATLAQLFLAHGVPGIKFMQYLAFTQEFKEFSEHFKEYQDQADPPTYLEAVRLLQQQWKDGAWPSYWEVKCVKGSGSVNIAVECFDRSENDGFIITVPRKEVALRSQVDFQSIDRFLEKLTESASGKDRYGYLLGLSRVIKQSVPLEFDRLANFEMLDSVQPIYNRTVNGWQVRTVKARGIFGDAIVMGMAPGESGRAIRDKNPDLYRDAMRALAQVELNVLLGMDHRNRPWPVALPANPDLHDGQVFIDIDEGTKTVTFLDFGQAIPISNKQRSAGIGLLDFLRRSADSDHAGAARALGRAMDIQVPVSEVGPILGRGEPLDRFIRTIDLIDKYQGEVPLPVVHWVMAIDRLRSLGSEIDQSIDPTMARVLMVRGIGGGLVGHNAGRLLKLKLQEKLAVR
jgi:hypothetical protein